MEMFSIVDLIKERQQYALGSKNTPLRDELLDHVINEVNQNEVVFITTGSTLFDSRIIDALQRKYHIIGAYKIGSIFCNTSIPFYMVHLSKTLSLNLRIAIFKGKCYSRHKVSKTKDRFVEPESYTEDWVRFMTILENWMNGDDIPDDNALWEFKAISRKQLYKGSLLPDTYTTENIELRELVDKQDTKPLSEVADILVPRVKTKDDSLVKVIKPKDLKYPFDIMEVDADRKTDITLCKGDILIPRMDCSIKAYLYNYDGKEIVYASQMFYVIRCKSILPEYLYLYLNSDVAVRVLNARYVGTVIRRITAKEIIDLPIAEPKYDKQRYISDFEILTNYGIRDYRTIQRLYEYYNRIKQGQGENAKPKVVEDILNIELANNIKAYREDQLRSFLYDDLKELNTCFRGKAYKATLILAGSILEAVLIDWLSEIHGKNYFEEEWRVVDRNGREKRADLIDYINEIKYLHRPRWVEEAEKAHEIRKKRNLVHAKLCLRSDDINEEVCREVISYLEDVLKTRGVTSTRT